MKNETHLVYRLSAPLGSMGTLAGNERRGTDDWPARSAITGMLGAALGIRRSERDLLYCLESDYAIALSRITLGPLMTDYHTAQTVPTSAAKRPSSRRNALMLGVARNNVGTVITHREYHEHCVFDVAVAAISVEPKWSLESLCHALKQPHYVLYFGRKACPLDLPLAPTFIEAHSAVDALIEYGKSEERPKSETSGVFLLDPHFVQGTPDGGRSVFRRDGVVNRERWTFSDRESVLLDHSEGSAQ